MLIGSYEVKLDQKGRIAVPKRLRGELGTNIVVARWYEGCLVIVDSSYWHEMVGKITGGEIVTLSARDTDRFLLAGSFEFELDHQGRFVVPQVLKRYAKLNDDVMCIGLSNRVEIWDKRTWEEREQTILLEAEVLAEKLFETQKQRNK